MEYVFLKNRRQFLRGVGGVSLALPILPSLLRVSKVEAQALGQQKYLAYMELPHGAVVQTAAYPADSVTTEMKTYAGFAIRRGALPTTSANGEVRFSDVLRAQSTSLTPGLIGKMNVLRGVDPPRHVGHGPSQTLGNFGDPQSNDYHPEWARPTIDQVMAWSPSFYQNTMVAERAIVLSDSISWGRSNPSAGTGEVQRVAPSAPTNLALFDKLFGTQTPTGPSATPLLPNTLLVDKIAENYQRLLKSGKLSSVDQKRIDEHLQRVFELQKRLSLPQQPLGAIPPRPTLSTTSLGDDGYDVNPSAQVQNWNLWTDIAVAAFSTGASRIFTAFLPESFSDHVGDWHDLAHSGEAERTPKFVAANQLFFEQVFLNFARKLDAVAMPDGTTLLDASLISWAHESGSESHYGTGLPIITFGSARGFLKTGQYVDYRNLNKVLPASPSPTRETSWHGLVWHQWLGTALQAMEVPAADYSGLAGGAAYPDVVLPDAIAFIGEDPGSRYPGVEAAYPDAVYAAAGEALPWLI